MQTQTDIIALAKSLAETPYKYGATMEEAPNVFDCSGFVKYLYQQIGYDIPRSTIEQAEFAGEKVESLDDIKPGYLLYLHGKYGHYNPTFPEGIGHVVMYLGDKEVIHAVSKRTQREPQIIEEGKVQIDKLDYVLEDSGPLVIIKRIKD